jgi:hypothetical protein
MAAIAAQDQSLRRSPRERRSPSPATQRWNGPLRSAVGVEVVGCGLVIGIGASIAGAAIVAAARRPDDEAESVA